MPTPLTVVYTVNDMSAFREKQAELGSQMMLPFDSPWRITAMSANDELRRLELIEQACESGDYHLIPAILSKAELKGSTSLEDFY